MLSNRFNERSRFLKNDDPYLEVFGAPLGSGLGLHCWAVERVALEKIMSIVHTLQLCLARARGINYAFYNSNKEKQFYPKKTWYTLSCGS